MKKGIKSFSAGLLAGVTIACAVGAFAYTDYIEAVYNNIKIVVTERKFVLIHNRLYQTERHICL